MNNFERENRYVVLKIKNMTEKEKFILVDFMNESGLNEYHTTCVVVESDWPIYEQVWGLVQSMAEGKRINNKPLPVFTTKAEEVIRQQAETINQLQARVGRLEEAKSEFNVTVANAETLKDLRDAIFDLTAVFNESPQQSLAHIQADYLDAIADEIDNDQVAELNRRMGYSKFGSVSSQWMRDRANQLRQSEGE